MRSTSFQGAEFIDAKLGGARLAVADLRGASLGDTDLSTIDLSTAVIASGSGITDEWLRDKIKAHEAWVPAMARCSF